MAPLSLYQFCQLLSRNQLLYTLMEGTYLARRWEGKCSGIDLYYLPDAGRGFFAEVGYIENQHSFGVLRSFSSSALLEDYAHGVRLPEE